MKFDILAFGAHPDDVELACGGTIIKHIQQGHKVAIVDLTQGELGSRGTAETRAAETLDANKIMGISERVNLKLADGFFEHNQQSLLLIIEQIRKYKPDIVLCNAVSDRHTDHGKAGKLVADAAFLSGLIKINTSFDGIPQDAWRPNAVYHYIQDRYIKPDFIVDISSEFDTKMKAIAAYKTQFYNPLDSSGPQTPISGKSFIDYLNGRAVEFGRIINKQYGEGFTVERAPGTNNLFNLI